MDEDVEGDLDEGDEISDELRDDDTNASVFDVFDGSWILIASALLGEDASDESPSEGSVRKNRKYFIKRDLWYIHKMDETSKLGLKLNSMDTDRQ